MQRYIELNCTCSPVQPWSEIFISELADAGFDSFIETEDGFLAYILESNYSPPLVQDILNKENVQVSYYIKEIEPENWNLQWEQSFEPIVVGDQCIVRAPFHQLSGNFKYDIIIEPKMSFGTGHHETTWQMMNQMLSMDLKAAKVLDMGCGTSVLAILAAKMGASEVLAIDIDDWSVENSLENLEKNKISSVHVKKGDATLLKNMRFNVILANINRNVLLKDIPTFSSNMDNGGYLLLSGFYQTDIPVIVTKASDNNLELINTQTKNSWAQLTFKRTEQK